MFAPVRSSEAWLLSKVGAANLKLVVNVTGKLQTEKNSCGIARFPYDSTAFLLLVQEAARVRTLLILNTAKMLYDE